ncbi:hypothetical protein ACEZDB_35935 [Streptacidiphilus sp. N1-3]|uniref:Uncharacterized protein n=1 Tax=Streptacidiphilus alkalitolerans TaxID=3342712 RepID=A0ABV6XCQ2_9ACTN
MQHATSNTDTTTPPVPEGPDAYWHGALQRAAAAQQATDAARAAQARLAGAV